MSASIIIGNYNYGRFLGQAIDSALAQTHPSVEVIVVDDGSTDNSREMIAGYGDRITSVLKANGGMASTYNAGFPLSRGELVIFLDADDMLLPTAVEAAFARLSETPGASKVHWALWEVDAGGRRTGGEVPQAPLPQGDLRGAVAAEGPDSYLSPPTSGNAWTRAFLETALPMPEPEFRQHADVYLATLAAAFGPVALEPTPQGLYRVHGGNDYAGKSIAEKNRRNLAIYEHRCEALARCLGYDAQPAAWREEASPYGWMKRLDAALEELRSIVPAGADFILADEEQWGEKRGGPGVLADRRALPFTEAGGLYNGPPTDDAAAIEEVERLRRAGAQHMVFAWPAFWWLEHYEGLSAHLAAHYPQTVDNPRLIAFDLTAPKPTPDLARRP